MTISLQNRLALTYALFISLTLGLLTLVINFCTGLFFTALVKNNIGEKSGEIVQAIAGQYNPLSKSFDMITVEAMGMYFVHQGYIVTVEDEQGGILWDSRSCDMEQCAQVINDISLRMEGRFGLQGEPRNQRYPVSHQGRNVGNVIIETYGPFFYSETEARFLASINRLLLIAGAFLILVSAVLSTLLARTIARPIIQAGEAARRIAEIHAGQTGGRNRGVRIPDNYHTRELAELSRSINDLAGRLEEGERRQKRLTADIAHELRTPLTCLRGNVEAMLDGVWAPSAERLESCHEEIIRLSKLVEDLNTLTAYEWDAITLQKTDFDLAKLLRAVMEQFGAAAREKGVDLALHCAGPAYPVNADYDRLKQVFINLLSNAVKYTDSGSVTITIEPGAKQWDVSVADTGIGIPGPEIPRVFERFYRSDKSRSRDTGGAGIGLAIAAAIVAAHDGLITVASEAGKGSVFRVRL